MEETPQEIISNLGLELKIPSENVKDFEKRILEANSKEKIYALKSNFVNWAFLEHDFNRMHIFQGYAIESNFKRTPMHGTWITAFEEQYVLKIKEVLEEFIGKKLHYNKHKIKFEKPIFPGLRSARAGWNLEKVLVNENGIELNISAKRQKRKNGKDKEYISSVVFLGYEKNQKSLEEIIEFLTGNNIVHKTKMEIKQGEKNHFYDLVNKTPAEEILIMHPAGFIPATLLELSSRRTGRPEGTYREIDFEFYNPPELGIFETTLKMSRPPKELPKGKGFLYKFEALCIQNNKPILKGKLNCVSPTEYKIIV